MTAQFKAALAFTIFIAVLTMALLVISPNPMPEAHNKVLTVLLALFMAGGFAIYGTRPPSKGQDDAA